MPSSTRPSGSSVGRFTGLILCLVVAICIAMIGGTGYLKYRMDRAEAVLIAPDSAIGSDQAALDRLRRVLGYGGFLGLAQSYLTHHDPDTLNSLKDAVRSADEIASRLPEQTSAEARHDISSIVSLYDAAAQKLADPGSGAVDLAPLYAALPILEARTASVNGATRMEAENQMHFWGMLLTLTSWCSLIIAAACAAGIYLTLRDKHSAPMRALAQSIQNMARGDMRTAIWGVERPDMVGELARAVDIARYHFSHLPDVSLLSEQGPVRLRFEGGARSLFEAMMKAISGDSESIRSQTASLTATVQQQKESISQIAAKIETVLEGILHRGQDGDQQIKLAIHEMAHSAENLKNAHAHAADQLNRIIPTLQERANGLAEIAQITGRQAAQSLQMLNASDVGLKANADQARDTLDRLSQTADDLGERLFGAINLLQASGKILAETTSALQSQIPAGDIFTGDTPTPAAIDTEQLLAPILSRVDLLVGQVADMQVGLGAQLDNLRQQALTLSAVSTSQGGESDPAAFRAALMPLQDRVEHLNASLRGEMRLALAEHIDPQLAALGREDALAHAQTRGNIATLEHRLASAPAATDPLPEIKKYISEQWHQIAAQLEASRLALDHAVTQQIGDRMTGLEQALVSTRASMAAMADAAANRPDQAHATLSADLRSQMKDYWYQIAGQIEATRAGLIESLSAQIAGLDIRMAGGSMSQNDGALPDATTRRQIEQQTQILSELVATLSALDSHMQQMQTEIHAVSGRA